jgi:hypothetical protein
MTKSFHPGRAAQNGLTAALLAARGYTSSATAIEAGRGWANVLSTHRDYREITDRLGESYEIRDAELLHLTIGIAERWPASLQTAQRPNLRPGKIQGFERGCPDGSTPLQLRIIRNFSSPHTVIRIAKLSRGQLCRRMRTLDALWPRR